MSFDALAWAAKAKGIRPAEKLVLLGLAECASRDDAECYPSIAALVEFGGLNRKTVIAALDSLINHGLIVDTGKVTGRTKQIKVYRLALQTVPKVERFQKRNSTEKSPKQSQKRDTDTVREPVIPTVATQPTEARAKPEKANPFPRPVWAEVSVWADFLTNRKLKRQPNTATAHKRFLNDVARLSNDEWPPPRLLEHAVAKGWAGIYDPREKQDGRTGTNAVGRIGAYQADSSGIGRTGRAALAAARMLHAAGNG